MKIERVEVYVTNVFVLVSAKSQQQWNLKDLNSYFKKMENIEFHLKEFIKNKHAQKQQNTLDGQNGKQGYLDKLLSKIIDNIFIQISNVHFRYDHDISKHCFSWGITIQQIEQETVDAQWEKNKFYDRNDLTDQAIKRRLSLVRFAVYWNSDDTHLICNQDPQYILIKMTNDLKFANGSLNRHDQDLKSSQGLAQNLDIINNIICLNSTAQLTQTINHQFQIPEFKLEVDFNEMNFVIKHTQVQEILWLIDYFDQYQFELKTELDLYRLRTIKPDFVRFKKITEVIEEEEKQQENFIFYQQCWQYTINKILKENMRKQYIEVYMKSLFKGKSIRSILSYHEFKLFKILVIRNNIKDLQNWTETAYEIKERNQNSNDIRSNKWKFWKKLESSELDQEKRLKQLIEIEVLRYKNINIPEEYVWLEFYLKMNIGSVKLTRRGMGIEEGFLINWEGLQIKLLERNNNYEVDLIIQDIVCKMFSIEEKNNVSIPIIKKISSYEYSDKPLFQIRYQKYPLSKPQYFSSIKLEFESIEIVLYLAAMRRILTYFRVTSSEENRDVLNQNIENLQNKASLEEIVSHSQRNEIKVLIQSPLFIIPSRQINDPGSDCWVFKLGDLTLNTIDKSLHSNYVQSAQLQPLILSSKQSSNRDKFSWDNVQQQQSIKSNISAKQSIGFIDNNNSSPINHNNSNSPISQSGSQIPFRNSQASNQKLKVVFQSPDSYAQGFKLAKVDNLCYDTFTLKLESVQVQYFSSMNFFYNYLKFHKSSGAHHILNHPLRQDSTKIDVIENFTIKAYIYTASEQTLNLPGKSSTKIRLQLEQLSVTLTPSIPQSLQVLIKTLSISTQNSTLSNILQQEKEQIIKFSTNKGYIKQRGSYFRSWTIYYAALSGWYIYFYLNEKDVQYDHYIGIKDATVIDCYSELGIFNTFKILTDKDIIYFQSQSQTQLKEWILSIQQKVQDISIRIIPSKTTFNQQSQQRNDPKISEEQLVKSNSFKMKFIINKIDIYFKQQQHDEKWLHISIDQVFLKILQVKSETYCRFSIKNILVNQNEFTILKSLIQLMLPISIEQTPIPRVKVKNVKHIQMKNNKMIQKIKNKNSRIKNAFKIIIIQSNLKSGKVSQILSLFSEYEINYRRSTFDRVLKFFSHTIQQQVVQQDDSLNALIIQQHSQKKINFEQNIEFQNIPKARSMTKQTKTDQKQQIDDENLFDAKGTDQSQVEENYMSIQTICRDIRVSLIDEKHKALLVININQLFGILSLGDDFMTLSGDVRRIQLIDMVTIGKNHTLFGCTLDKNQQQQKDADKKRPVSTIFSSAFKEKQHSSSEGMVQFVWSHLSENSSKITDNTYDTLQLQISYSFIDYLHESQQYFVKYFDREKEDIQVIKKQFSASLQNAKPDIFELEKDFELLAQKILNPKLYKINVVWLQPQILLRPLIENDQQIVFTTQKILLEVECSLEKNRFSLSKSTELFMASQKLESLWCQNVIFEIRNMQINMKHNFNQQTPISNPFNVIFRLQTPLYIDEYQCLFPNMGNKILYLQEFDQSKEIRLTISNIDLRLIRSDYLFFMEVVNTNLLYERNKQDARFQFSPDSKISDNIITHDKKVGNTIIYFSCKQFRVQLMELFNNLSAKYKILPIVEFQSNNMFLELKLINPQNKFQFIIEQIQIYQYEYYDDFSNVQMTRRGMIQNILVKTLDFKQFIQDNDLLIYTQKEVTREYIADQLKLEFYNQSLPEKGQISFGGYFDDQSSELNIKIVGSKILFNMSFMVIISKFFAPNISTSPKPQNKKEQSHESETLEQNGCRKIQIDLKKSIIIAQGFNIKHVLIIQGEILLRSEDFITEQYHKAYHLHDNKIDQNDEFSNQKVQRIHMFIDNLQIYSAYFEQIAMIQLSNQQQMKNLRKRQILYETKIEYIAHIFECCCQNSISQIIHEETVKIDKIRIHISYHDLNHLYEIYNFQQEAAKEVESIFSQDLRQEFHQKLEKIYSYSNEETQFGQNFFHRSENIEEIVDSPSVGTFKKIRKQSTRQTLNHKNSLKLDLNKLLVKEFSLNASMEFKEDKQAPSNQLILHKRAIILEGLEVVIINDLSRSYVPFMLFNATIENFIIENNDETQLMAAEISFILSYFNPVAGRMEPIVEKNSLNAHAIRNYNHQPYLYLIIEKLQKKQNRQHILESADLNINLSTDMLAILIRTIKLWRKQFDLSQQNNELEVGNFISSQNDKQTVSGWGSINTPINNQIGQSRILQRVSLLNNSSDNVNGQIDKVTLFTVQNISGYTLRVMRESQALSKFLQSEELQLSSGQTRNYVIESHEDEYAKTFEDNQKITISFKDKNQNDIEIQNIQVNEVNTKRFDWKSENVTFDSQGYFIFSIQMQNINKTIVISSPYILENKINCQIVINLINLKYDEMEFSLDQNKRQAIPADLVDHQTFFRIKFQDRILQRNSHFSDPIQLLKIIQQKNPIQYTEIEHGEFLTIVRNEKRKDIPGVNNITFHPIAYLKNCLPVPIDIYLHSDQNQFFQQKQINLIQIEPIGEMVKSLNLLSPQLQKVYSDDKYNFEYTDQVIERQSQQTIIEHFSQFQSNSEFITVEPQGEFQILNMSQKETLKCHIKVQGFRSSSVFVLYEPNTDAKNLVQVINMHSGEDFKNTVKVLLKREIQPCHYHFYFHAECCIINSTPFDLCYYTFEQEKNLLLPGQGQDAMKINHSNQFRSINSGSKFNDSTMSHNILICNDNKNLMIGLSNSVEKSNEVQLSVLGLFQVQLKHKTEPSKIHQLYEFGIHISILNASGLHDYQNIGIVTKVIEISPKYVIVNNSDSSITLRQSGDSKSEIKVHQGEREVLVWSDCRKEKSIQIRSLYGSFEWSGEIFIDELRTANFYSLPQVKGDLIQRASTIQLISPTKQNTRQLTTPSKDIISSKKSLHQENIQSFQALTPTLKEVNSVALIKTPDSGGQRDQVFLPTQMNSHKKVFQFKKASVNYENENDYDPLQFDNEAILYNAQVIKQGSTLFVLIETAGEDTYAYKLINDCKYIKVWFSQYSYDDKINQEWFLPQNAHQPFAWENPSQKQKLNLKFQVIHQRAIQIQNEVLDLVKFTKNQYFSIQRTDGFIVKICLETQFKGKTQLLKLSDSLQSDQLGRQMSQEEVNQQAEVKKIIQVQLDSLGISFIIKNKQRIVEANYLLLRNIEFGFVEKVSYRTAQLRIKFFSIDNNSAYDTTTPVSVTPQKCKKYLYDPNSYSFDLSFQRNHLAEAIYMIDFFRLSVCPITVRLDEEYVVVLAEALNDFRTQFEADTNDQVVNSFQPTRKLVFYQPQKRLEILRAMIKQGHPKGYQIWNSIEIHQSRNLIYAKQILLPPIDIIISFHKKFVRSSQSETFYLFNIFSNTVGTAIQNINDAPIFLLGLKMENLNDTHEILAQTIYEHYKSEFVRSLFTIIGSIEIIGNPVGFLQRISVGVIDFVEKPIQGLKHGPLDFGVGLLQGILVIKSKGTGSLVKNTLSGAFYTINKFTGSISTGVSLLTMDDEFLERRRIFMLKPPKHIIDGLGQGCKSVFNGFAEGFTGVVLQPIRGTQKDGLIGLLKGTAKGLAGLIVKPITGILDASAKTAESISNTATHYDDKAFDSRVRLPRVFYEKSHFFQEYNQDDSLLISYLQTFDQGKYKDIDYLCHFQSIESLSKVLVISFQYIFIVDVKQNIVLYQVNTQHIKDCTMEENLIYLQTQDRCDIIDFHSIRQEDSLILAKIHYLIQQG